MLNLNSVVSKYSEKQRDRCPCCGCFLRANPRNAKIRDKLVQKKINVKNFHGLFYNVFKFFIG